MREIKIKRSQLRSEQLNSCVRADTIYIYIYTYLCTFKQMAFAREIRERTCEEILGSARRRRRLYDLMRFMFAHLYQSIA